MSFEAMAAAVKVKLPAPQKLVLLLLANRTNADTGRCDPSHQRLATDAGMSVSGVKKQIKALQEAGLISIEQRKVGDVNLPNRYILLLEGVGHNVPPLGTARGEGGAPCNPGVGHGVSTNQEGKPGIKTTTPTPTGKDTNGGGGFFSIPEPIPELWERALALEAEIERKKKPISNPGGFRKRLLERYANGGPGVDVLEELERRDRAALQHEANERRRHEITFAPLDPVALAKGEVLLERLRRQRSTRESVKTA